MLRKFFCYLFLFFYCFKAFAFTPQEIIFFGDSLSDNGNLYKLLLKLIPKSPPYFEGRFSNGVTWAENVGNYYHQSNINYKIYAYGGATALFTMPTDEFLAPTNLENEINQYIFESLFKNKSKTLFVIWIGGNDYLFDPKKNNNPQAINDLTQKVVDKISWALETLIFNGGRHFLVLNMPDLSLTPFATINDKRQQLHDLSVTHNEKLQHKMSLLKNLHPDSEFLNINVYDIFNEVVNHPEKFNEKYHIHIIDVTHSCWEGGYTYENNIANPAIKESERIAWAYHRGQEPCQNADEYIFWDRIHPTRVVHTVLSQLIIENMNKYLIDASI